MTAPPSSTRNHSKTMNGDPVHTDLLEQPDQSSAEPKFTLSATQVAASVAAAVTAAVVGSRLGVAGTVIGAGLASVISVVGGAIFGHSILFTRKQVKRAVLQVRGAGTAMVPTSSTTIVPTSPDDDRTVVIPAVNTADLTMALGSRPGPERTEPGRPRPTRRRVGTGLVLAVTAAAAVFASSLGAVTLIEAVKGSPLAGGDSGGLSVLGGNGGTSVQETTDTGTPPADPTTVTQTVTSEVVSTATTTEQAPSSTAATPSGAEQSSTSTATSPTSEPAPTTQPTMPSPTGAAGTPTAVATAGQLSGAAGSGSEPR